MSNPFAKFRENTQKRLGVMTNVEEVIAHDPEFGRMLWEVLQAEYGTPTLNGSGHRRSGGRPKGTQNARRLKKVIAELTGKGWVGTPTLQLSTKLNKGKIMAVLKGNPDKFESQKDPDWGKRLQWRLKEMK